MHFFSGEIISGPEETTFGYWQVLHAFDDVYYIANNNTGINYNQQYLTAQFSDNEFKIRGSPFEGKNDAWLWQLEQSEMERLFKIKSFAYNQYQGFLGEKLSLQLSHSSLKNLFYVNE